MPGSIHLHWEFIQPNIRQIYAVISHTSVHTTTRSSNTHRHLLQILTCFSISTEVLHRPNLICISGFFQRLSIHRTVLHDSGGHFYPHSSHTCQCDDIFEGLKQTNKDKFYIYIYIYIYIDCNEIFLSATVYLGRQWIRVWEVLLSFLSTFPGKTFIMKTSSYLCIRMLTELHSPILVANQG